MVKFSTNIILGMISNFATTYEGGLPNQPSLQPDPIIEDPAVTDPIISDPIISNDDGSAPFIPPYTPPRVDVPLPDYDPITVIGDAPPSEDIAEHLLRNHIIDEDGKWDLSRVN